MKKCVIWGAGQEYEAIINQIKFEEFKGTLECIALLSKTVRQFAKKRDGYDIIGPEDLSQLTFDYLIVAATQAYKQIEAEALALGVPRSKIIASRVFKISGFDFGRYASLRENPVTIFSDDCWGGVVYRMLDLPFTSPLINIAWPTDSFLKFVQDPLFYLDQPLHMVQDTGPRRDQCAIAQLGDDDRSVRLGLVHAKSFSEGKEEWNRRKGRINLNRIFVKLSLSTTNNKNIDVLAINNKETHREDEYLKNKYLSIFDQLPYEKICVYSGKSNISDVIYTKRFDWEWYHTQWVNSTSAATKYRAWFIHPENFPKVIDVLKLLNGERDYIREQ